MTKALEIIEGIYDTQEVEDGKGNIFPLEWHIGHRDGEYLQFLIRKFQPQRSLEIGLAYGVSSLYICDALSEVKGEVIHTIIDPLQGSLYKNIGLLNLERAGLDGMVEFHEAPSEHTLPLLWRGNRKFDFIFIDGCHEFAYCFLDFFYSSKLLVKNGVLVFDDCDFPTIRKVVDYVDEHPGFKRLGSVKYECSPPGERVIAFQKISEKDYQSF